MSALFNFILKKERDLKKRTEVSIALAQLDRAIGVLWSDPKRRNELWGMFFDRKFGGASSGTPRLVRPDQLDEARWSHELQLEFTAHLIKAKQALSTWVLNDFNKSNAKTLQELGPSPETAPFKLKLMPIDITPEDLRRHQQALDFMSGLTCPVEKTLLNWLKVFEYYELLPLAGFVPEIVTEQSGIPGVKVAYTRWDFHSRFIVKRIDAPALYWPGPDNLPFPPGRAPEKSSLYIQPNDFWQRSELPSSVTKRQIFYRSICYLPRRTSTKPTSEPAERLSAARTTERHFAVCDRDENSGETKIRYFGIRMTSFWSPLLKIFEPTVVAKTNKSESDFCTVEMPGKASSLREQLNKTYRLVPHTPVLFTTVYAYGVNEETSSTAWAPLFRTMFPLTQMLDQLRKKGNPWVTDFLTKLNNRFGAYVEKPKDQQPTQTTTTTTTTTTAEPTYVPKVYAHTSPTKLPIVTATPVTPPPRRRTEKEYEEEEEEEEQEPQEEEEEEYEEPQDAAAEMFTTPPPRHAPTSRQLDLEKRRRRGGAATTTMPMTPASADRPGQKRKHEATLPAPTDPNFVREIMQIAKQQKADEHDQLENAEPSIFSQTDDTYIDANGEPVLAPFVIFSNPTTPAQYSTPTTELVPTTRQTSAPATPTTYLGNSDVLGDWGDQPNFVPITEPFSSTKVAAATEVVPAKTTTTTTTEQPAEKETQSAVKAAAPSTDTVVVQQKQDSAPKEAEKLPVEAKSAAKTTVQQQVVVAEQQQIHHPAASLYEDLFSMSSMRKAVEQLAADDQRREELAAKSKQRAKMDTTDSWLSSEFY
jgi:hypothetical protein